jgi:hypothetical protein
MIANDCHRFETVSLIALDSLVLVTTICSVYVIAFVLISVNSALLCCVRMTLIINLNFLEERMGEKSERPVYKKMLFFRPYGPIRKASNFGFVSLPRGG